MFPIEQALGKKATTGWKAAETGPQLIRLHFDEPLTIKRMQLHFVDKAAERSQEFAVFAGAGCGVEGSGAAAVDVFATRFDGRDGRLSVEPEWDYDAGAADRIRIRSHDPKQSHEYASLQSLKLA